ASRVYSEYSTLGSPAEVEDIISVSFQMNNGAVGNLFGSSIMRGFPQQEERISGTHGSMVINEQGISLFSNRPIDGKRPGQVNNYTKFPDVSWTADWVKDFVSAVRAGTTPPVSSREGWENLAFITNAYSSMERGKVEMVPAFESVPAVASV